MTSRNRQSLYASITGVVLLTLTACSGAASPSAAELFTLVTETDPFENWAQFPEAQGILVSGPPHGPSSRVFINEPVEGAIDNFTGNLPNGSIIVKENLGESTADKAESWNIMWKVSGFDPDNNDWFWANITPDGAVNAQGKLDGCISCHSARRANDFIFLHQF